MSLSNYYQRATQAFFHWGWLLPALLPASQLGGRGLFNSLVCAYALWGMASCWQRRVVLPRCVVIPYALLLGAFLLSVPGAVDSTEALHTWLTFALQSLVLLLILAALGMDAAAAQRLLNALALGAALTLGTVYLLLPYHLFALSGQPFAPEYQLREDNLPFLLPFMLGWLWQRRAQRWCYAAMFAVSALVLGYIVLSQGRAALLGMVVSLALFSAVVWQWRWRRILGLVGLVLLLGIALNIQPFLKMQLDPMRPLDAFTAGRSALWRQALAEPPPRPLVGVGLGNVAQNAEMLRFQLGDDFKQVKHLHNFLLDAWYETGLLGLGALLGMLGSVLVRLLLVWRDLSVMQRQQAGIWLAAAAALLSAGLLSFSYTSRQFACYLFLCLGGLSHLCSKPKTVLP